MPLTDLEQSVAAILPGSSTAPGLPGPNRFRQATKGDNQLMRKSISATVLLAAMCGLICGCGGKKLEDEGAGKPMPRATAGDSSVPSLSNPKPSGTSGK